MAALVQTLIVGGGISGLACARRLCDARCDFVLLTDRLGGRMHHSPDGSMNFGASYINADYRHVLRFVAPGQPFKLREAYFQGDDGLATMYRLWTLRSAIPLVRLVRRIREVRRHLQAFRREAEHVPQSELIDRYPLLDRYRRQPAAELIKELHLEALEERYFKLTFETTVFTQPANANALYYLCNLFPAVIPTWAADFTHTYDRLTAGYRQQITFDRATALDRRADGTWEVRSACGQGWRARNVVLAAPYHNARALYPVPRPYLTTSATLLYVRGRRRADYRDKRFLLLQKERTGVSLIWQQGEKDQVYSFRERPDLATLYEAPQALGCVTWKTGLVVSDTSWAPLRLEPHLYLVGDYNLCGLEDSYLTGLCAANHILRGDARP